VSSVVEVCKECFSVSLVPELLAIASRPGIGKFLLGVTFPRRVLSEKFFVDTPTEKRRDVVPVGVGR
jgi:hypothetical protein